MMTLLEAAERVPLDPLTRRVRAESDPQALTSLLNALLARMADGYKATWGRLTLTDMDQLLRTTQTRLDMVCIDHTRRLQARKETVTRKPYLDLSLSHHDPRRPDEQTAQSPTTTTGSERADGGVSGTRPRRRVRRTPSGEDGTA